MRWHVRNVLLMMIGACFGIVALAFVHAHAQEKPARPTRQWQLGALPWSYESAEQRWYRDVRLDVFDTEGVCLYVARAADSSSNDGTLSVTSVPKTQLPKGAGCQ